MPLSLSRKSLDTIWVLCGGPSSEHEVSLSSGKVVCEHLTLKGRNVRPVVVDRQGRWIISKQIMSEANSDRTWLKPFFHSASAEWDAEAHTLPQALAAMLEDNITCALLAFHGPYGEDGGMQGFLQTAGIPFTGSGILATAAALNKTVALATFARCGLPVANSIVVTREDPFPDRLSELSYPLFTKPVCGGSSLGVSLIKSSDDLKAGILHALEHDTSAMAEEKIPGVEVSCGVVDFIEDDRVVSRAMPPTLISPLEAEFFDYAAKYVPGKSRDVTPAPLPPDVVESIREAALKAHSALGCEGMSRTDMIVETTPGSRPVMLEIQTIPGMTPTSLLPQQCAAVGISFASFLDTLIQHAKYRSSQT